MDDQTFNERFALHVEPLQPELAREVLDATLEIAADALDHHAIQALQPGLPPGLRSRLAAGSGPRTLSPEDMSQSVAGRLGLSESRAVELVQVVLEALAALLDPHWVSRLRRELGEAFEPLLQPREPSPSAHVPHAGHRTLAEGQPGSGKPLSEAHPKPSHTHSVNHPNPHGDTKISSTEDRGKAGAPRPSWDKS